MRVLLVAALVELLGCGGADQQDRAVQAPSAASPSASAVETPTDEVRRGCSSFTEALANEHSNEVYDPQTGVLQVWVGPERFLLSSAVEECRENPVAMQRLKFADAEETRTQEGVRHVLYTHCGVVSTTVDGVLWLAEPPLSDDSGNPPPGWDENDTSGLFRQADTEHAVFVADSGVQANFTKAKPGATDPAADCE